MRVRFRTIIGAIGGATLAASVAWAATTTLTLGTANGPGGIVVLEGATSGSVTVQPPAVAGTTTFTLPGNNGSNTNVLQTDGSGNTSWVASAGGTGANPTAIAKDTAVNGSASTFLRSDGAPAIQKGTNAQFGIVEGDGSTITCVLGVCTAIGGSATSVVPGTTTVGGATAPCLIDNSTGTTMGCAAMGAGLSLSGGALTPAGRTAVADANCGTLTNATALVGFTTVLTAARSCTLPAASTLLAGQQIKFVDEGSGTAAAINGSNTVTINRAGSDKIANATSIVMGQPSCSITLATDGSTNWGVVANSCATVPVAQGGTGLTSGTSGGVLAYTASGTLASSGALTANLPVIGGGAGVAPTVGTRSGNTTAYVTTTGSQTSGDCVKIDASGNHVANGSACGAGGGGNFTKISKQTASNSASLDWSSVTTYSHFKLECEDLITASSDQDIMLQLVSSGTPVTSNYKYVLAYNAVGVGAITSNVSGSAAGMKLGSATTSIGHRSSTKISNITLTGNTKKIDVESASFVAGDYYFFNGGGFYTGDTNAYNGLRIVTSGGGNITSGYCTLYGLD